MLLVLSTGCKADPAAQGQGRKVLDQGDCVAGADTIQEAINTAGPGDVVHVCGGNNGAGLVVTHDVIIEGAGADLTRLDGDDKVTAIEVSPNAVLTLRDVTVRGGGGTGRGGGIVADQAGGLILERVIITGNAGSTGAGVVAPFAPEARGEFTDTVITENVAVGDAGRALLHHATLVNTVIGANVAGTGGGGILVSDGGAITADETTVVEANSATEGGGVVLGARATWTGGVVRANQAITGGGVLLRESDGQTFDGLEISDNTADLDGAGLAALTRGLGEVTVRSVVFSGNIAGERGGGLYWNGGGALDLFSCRLVGNSAQGGGGLIVAGAAVTRDESSELVDNTADAGAGALVEGGSLLITGKVAGNAASVAGGGVRLEDGRVASQGGLWGDAADANAPDDVSFESQAFTFGGGEVDFLCDSETGCETQ